MTAGTLNPQSPKQIVPSGDIANWLGCEQGQSMEGPNDVKDTESSPLPKDCP